MALSLFRQSMTVIDNFVFLHIFRQIEPISLGDIFHRAKLLNCIIAINNSYPKRRRICVIDRDVIKI